jgi:hypothetical protein
MVIRIGYLGSTVTCKWLVENKEPCGDKFTANKTGPRRCPSCGNGIDVVIDHTLPPKPITEKIPTVQIELDGWVQCPKCFFDHDPMSFTKGSNTTCRKCTKVFIPT